MEKELSIEQISKLDAERAAFPFSLLQDFLTFKKHCRQVKKTTGSKLEL
jgi:hypothetical protein